MDTQWWLCSADLYSLLQNVLEDSYFTNSPVSLKPGKHHSFLLNTILCLLPETNFYPIRALLFGVLVRLFQLSFSIYFYDSPGEFCAPFWSENKIHIARFSIKFMDLAHQNFVVCIHVTLLVISLIYI